MSSEPTSKNTSTTGSREELRQFALLHLREARRNAAAIGDEFLIYLVDMALEEVLSPSKTSRTSQRRLAS